MDPQQRLLMEVAWEALEHAGITKEAIRGTQTGVFVGMTTNDYALDIVSNIRPAEIDPYVPFGNAANFAAGRLSYFLGVHGPAVMLDTACSSSLVTIHLACASLRRRESDQALAAGVNLMLTPQNSVATSRWGMLAPDGQCKTFDAGADGYVRSEGAGVVVLKRLSDAQRDGDRVLAVVRGSAVNQDGPSSGQTVPSGPAQQKVVRAALAAARLEPGDIDYVEAHGTGTALGDPIELDALSAVFGERGSSAPLVLGSVKTNLGHLESASGVAGFIKTVLAVQQGFIPRHLNFSELTPNAGVGASKFQIAAQAMAWPAVSRPRRAGVSSFGVSGTNAHVVIEQAPVGEPVESVGPVAVPVVQTLVVSGKSPARIAATAGVLAQWMAGDGAEVPLADIAHTLNHHRTRHQKFATVAARDREQAITGLAALAAGESAPGLVGPATTLPGPGTVFVFSGQGSHWVGMGRRLLADEPVFAAAVDELEPVFVAQVGFSLREVIAQGVEISGDAQVQPVIMGLQLALAELWRSYGVVPDAVVGHSMGEVSAAVVAGALTPEQGLRVIAVRSRLMSRQAGQGAVALLELDAGAVQELLAQYPQVAVAGYLSPRQTVVAGSPADVDAVIAAVSARERFARRVNMEVASHTAFMDPILAELRAELADLVPSPGQIPFFSTVVDPAGPTPVLDADYWADNVRQPARVSEAIVAAGEKYGTFIEVSPHPILTHTIDENLETVPHRSVATLVRDGDDTVGFHQHLNSAHPVSPRELPHPAEPHPLLPTTPWRHTHHWLETESSVTAAESAPRPGVLLGTHIKIGSTPTVHLWQARLAPEAKPYPGDHRNNGVELVPASVLLQTLSDAAAEVSGQPVVSDIRFEHPIIVDRPRTIQVVADADSVVVLSKAVSAKTATDDGDGRWIKHLSARIAPRGESVPDATDVMHKNGHAGTQFDDEAVTSLWLTWGSEGRPFDWSISSGRSTPVELRADIEAAVGTVGLLDAALHVARLVDESNPELMVPAAVDNVRFGEPSADGRAGVTVQRRQGGEGELVVDIVVATPDGRRCVDIRGLRYTALDAATQAQDPSSIAHAIEWQPWDAAPQTPDLPGTLAVVGEGAAAEALRGGLTGAGHRTAGVTEAQSVVYVADSRAGETDLDCASRLVGEVSDLVARLAEREAHPPALWIITHGVHEALSDAAVRQSCLWGLAGVIRAEQPQLCGGLVDLPEDPAGIADCIATLSTVLRTPAKSILVLRDRQFLAPTFTPVSGPPQREPMVCQPDGAYLITGGMGALGLLMAGWLADRGARRLVLAGRSALPPRRDWDADRLDADVRHKIAGIRALERRGVTVDVAALDIGSRDGVIDLLARRDAAGAPPIRGIIHAAGVTEGQLLTEVDEDRLRDTMWPKVAGAQVLHELFPPASVDFFFMTAAAGAVFGVPGQGAYASANAYLDGLARARHQRGCHSVSLDWVAWKGLGFGAEAHVVLHELERMGSRPISPAEAFAAWDHVEHYDVAQAVMVPLPREGKPGESAADGGAPTRDWAQLPADEILSELEIGLRSILARELRMSEAELQLDRPFAELGLNSVMAMAVRREIEQLVGLELSATMLWNHPTTAALAAHLTGKLLPQEDSGHDPAAANGELPESADSVLNELFDSVESAPAGWDGI
ncbi:phthiocerol synthesis polyketide synthase type I PpsA [Mycolicibacter terrae]|uniref:Phthiocerol synthesis polyketide synthase type I PpsA n=6 Tax=Mycolicibacter terrae TaxID=1788 RepID=A0AAD1HY02_9MYCO|nr:phthiocerol synthesis polyketide synthase type I PpsA [Mycolicibacter terrae]SNV74741.1 beta-ketoacyl synthase [Mycolicibacter terrae]